MTTLLPFRHPPGVSRRWDRFVAVAASSRSAQELLTAELRRPVAACPISNRVVCPETPLPSLQLAAGELPVRVLGQLLVDTRPPHRVLGLCTTVLVAARLPASVRGPARRGENTLGALLEAAGACWTAETREVEQIHSSAALYDAALYDAGRDGADRSDAGRGGDVPAVRLTRLLYLLGTPVAAVVEDVALPEPASGGLAGRSPPAALPRF